MKRLRIKKALGEWMYEKIMPDAYNDLDGTIWKLYKVIDGKPVYEHEFAYYGDMKYYIETGILI